MEDRILLISHLQAEWHVISWFSSAWHPHPVSLHHDQQTIFVSNRGKYLAAGAVIRLDGQRIAQRSYGCRHILAGDAKLADRQQV